MDRWSNAHVNVYAVHVFYSLVAIALCRMAGRIYVFDNRYDPWRGKAEMSKFQIQYTVEALNLGDATSVAYELLYGANVDAEDVRVMPVYQSPVRTFDEVSDSLFEEANQDFKRDHPWGS